jgi:hypothetical protein
MGYVMLRPEKAGFVVIEKRWMCTVAEARKSARAFNNCAMPMHAGEPGE